jgi:nucleoside-diphosphate-sugar epimerase
MRTIPTTDQPDTRTETGPAGVHVVVGKGPVGTATAQALLDAGHRVRVLSRSGGTSPELVLDAGAAARLEARTVDAADAASVVAASEGAATIYNCLNPEYHRWATDWPPMATALLDAAEAHDAGYVIMGNLYGYGPARDGGRRSGGYDERSPMTESTPLAAEGTKGVIRVRMWEEAIARHRAGRVRVTEARAADFYGPLVTDGGYLGERTVPPLVAGKRPQFVGNPTLPHSFTYIPDVGRALATLGTDDRSWGRAWHVPTAPARSAQEMVTRLCELAGVEPVEMRVVPHFAVRLAGLFVPFMRELEEVRYQFVEPFVLDSSDFTETFGWEATPIDEALAATLAWWRARLGAGAQDAATTARRGVPPLQ